MNIALIEPFFGGSHEQWALSLKAHSSHTIEIFSLPGRHWKWRMHGAAISLAEKVNTSDFKVDLFLCSDMLDLALFKSLLNNDKQGRFALYMHENQLTYPWSPTDQDVQLKRDRHYGFINYSSALVADKIFFNSAYHKNSFLDALPAFLNAFPDARNLDTIDQILNKSEVLHLGLSLSQLLNEEDRRSENKNAVLLWNHRWEYDKNPSGFFNALFELQNRGIRFELIVAGEQYKSYPPIFDEAKKRLDKEIIHWGYAESRDAYNALLLKADLLPVSSHQDFFGISIVEAMAANAIPLLPKRLAYPEHIPESLHRTFFYENEADFANLIQRRIMNVKVLRKQQSASFVEQYDWSNMINRYDKRFEEIR